MREAGLRLLEVRENASGTSEWVELAPKAPTRRRRVTATMAGLLVAMILLLGMPVREQPEREVVRVTVAKGDTLWALARRHGHPSQYLPRLTYEIRHMNRLHGSQISPGQTLLVPRQAPARVRWQPGVALALAERD